MRRKSKIIAAIAVVVILSMSLAAFALASTQPTVGKSPDSPRAGETVTFTINIGTFGLQGNVSASDNREFVPPAVRNGGIGPTTGEGFAVLEATSITYTYRVKDGTAANAPFWFEINNLLAGDADANEVPLTSTVVRVSATVAGPQETTSPSPDPTNGNGNGTTPTPGGTTPTPGGTPDTPRPPKVGDDSASAAPVVIGGIAVLVIALGIFGYVKLK